MNYKIVGILLFCPQSMTPMNNEKNITEEKIEIVLNLKDISIDHSKEEIDSSKTLKRRSSPPKLGSQNTLKSDLSLENNRKESRKSLKKNLNSKNPSFSGKTDKVFFKNSSHDTMILKKDFITFDIPEELVPTIQTSHTLDVLAHNEIHKKIEGVEYQVKQMCEKGFDCNDKLVKMSAEQKRTTRFNRLLFCGCTAFATVYIVLSITGIVLAVHYIPLP